MLIELEELKHKINNSKYYGTDAWRDILDMAVDCDSKSRPKGEWIEKGYLASRRWYCSVCNEWQTYGKTKFCPQCGADMRQTENEDEKL